jgi:hypothetical protein
MGVSCERESRRKLTGNLGGASATFGFSAPDLPQGPIGSRRRWLRVRRGILRGLDALERLLAYRCRSLRSNLCCAKRTFWRNEPPFDENSYAYIEWAAAKNISD